MKRTKEATAKGHGPLRLSVSLAIGAAVLSSAPAFAVPVDTGNEDVKVNWTNAVRYNAGWRAQKVDDAFYNQSGYDESEGYKRGRMIVNRLDLLSEVDVSYKEKYGFRVSGAAWTNLDNGSHSSVNPAINSSVIPNISNYGPSGSSPYSKRMSGTSGQWLDAFVYGGWQLDDTAVRVKVGQHTQYWGEAMFTTSNAIANNQAPIDAVKATTSPGAEVKELFMPTPKIAGSILFPNQVALNAFYDFGWKPFQVVPANSYFSTGDTTGNLMGNDPGCVQWAPTAGGPACAVTNLKSVMPKRTGDLGVSVNWDPSFWDGGSMGLYYRKYTEKTPWGVVQLFTDGVNFPSGVGLALAYPRDTEMFGWSMNKSVGPVSLSAELSYRKDTGLNSVGGFLAGSQKTGIPSFILAGSNPAYSSVEGARGDTYHGVINGQYLMPHTAFSDAGVFVFELSYQRLDKVTTNPNVYYSVDNACKAGGLSAGLGKKDGCATKDAWSLNLLFDPSWSQVLPSWDLDTPMSLAYGLSGNAPTLQGTYEGSYTYSIGATMKYQNVHEFGLAYNGGHTSYNTTTCLAGGLVPGSSNACVAGSSIATTAAGTSGGAGMINRKGWLSFHYKTSF